jgi:hypothetical protein
VANRGKAAQDTKHVSEKADFFLSFVVVEVEPYAGVKSSNLGDTAMHQFSVGEIVTCIPDMILRHAAPGGYRVIAHMPDRDGDHMYKIKSPLEEHERVVKECLLVRSEGSLIEDVPVRHASRRGITLPSLARAVALEAA